jgi:hypothetical protein
MKRNMRIFLISLKLVFKNYAKMMKLRIYIYLSFMLFKGISLIVTEEEYIEEIEIIEDNSCTKYIVFHFCAFTLGAF